jgi:hypothetical protein
MLDLLELDQIGVTVAGIFVDAVKMRFIPEARPEIFWGAQTSTGNGPFSPEELQRRTTSPLNCRWVSGGPPVTFCNQGVTAVAYCRV